jgi:hypothetical protein
LIDDCEWSEGLAARARRLAEGLTWDTRALKIRAFLEQRLATADQTDPKAEGRDRPG